MKKFIKITSTAIPLAIENIDTDQIIPARFLKATDKKGFAEKLFNDWRYDNNGDKREDFILNNSLYKGDILVAGDNFGCGSSREHAAWAIAGYGISVVISSSFADIFKANALNNGILPVIVSADFLSKLFNSIKIDPQTTITVDLEKQVVTNNHIYIDEKFEINPFKREALLNGLDDIEYLLSNREKIVSYEINKKLLLSHIN